MKGSSLTSISDRSAGERNLASSQPRSSLAEDITQGATEVVLSAIPVVGSALQTTFAAAANIISNRKTEAWLSELAVAVDHLAASQGLSVEDVVADPAFYEAVIRGTRAAQTTMREEKLAAIRGVVISSGSWSTTPELVQQACMRLVDELQAEHFALLQVFAHPELWLSSHPEVGDGETIRMEAIFATIFDLPGAGAADFMAMRFIDELYQRGLLTQSVGPAYTINRLGAVDANITPLGRVLVDMLSNA